MGDFILETVEKEHNRMALNVAALAGDILLASGAEIFRVEETINRIAQDGEMIITWKNQEGRSDKRPFLSESLP